MKKLNIIFRSIILIVACIQLSACLGGTVAQQIVRSVATSIADKSLARAMDVDENQRASNRKPDYSSPKPQNVQLDYKQQLSAPTSAIMQPYQSVNTVNTEQAKAANNLRISNLNKKIDTRSQSDPYKVAIANTAFKELKPSDIVPIIDPLPSESLPQTEEIANVIQISQLVPVELFNLLINEEKNVVFERARLLGAQNLPQKREWKFWQVASGALLINKKPITFIIPPGFGKLPAGSITMVELAAPGELNVVRYKTQ